MANILTEVMKMDNQEQSFLQKVKDNAFYVALGLGLLAVLAVVAVYTVEQNEQRLVQQKTEQDIELVLETTEDTIDVAEDSVTEHPLEEWYSNMDEAETESENEEIAEINSNEMEMTTEEETTENVETQEASAMIQNEFQGELNFTSDKTITWPIGGTVLLPFSMETTVYFKTLDQYRCNPGMLIQADEGEEIHNSYLGQVTNITSDDTYGNMVTLYIGNDYSLVYGQLDEIYVEEGQFVKMGEIIGTISAPTDTFSSEGSHLFFQMIKDEEAIDPMLFVE